MDAERISELRRWGRRLQERERAGEELRAAGRAILMLVDEIESLRLALTERRKPEPDGPSPPVDDERAEPMDFAGEEQVPGLGHWLKRTFGSGSVEADAVASPARNGAPELGELGEPPGARDEEPAGSTRGRWFRRRASGSPPSKAAEPPGDPETLAG